MKTTNTDRVLKHLLTAGTITPVEALVVHKVQRLAPRILELRKEGWEIETVRCEDEAGTPYFKYVLA